MYSFSWQLLHIFESRTRSFLFDFILILMTFLSSNLFFIFLLLESAFIVISLLNAVVFHLVFFVELYSYIYIYYLIFIKITEDFANRCLSYFVYISRLFIFFLVKFNFSKFSIC